MGVLAAILSEGKGEKGVLQRFKDLIETQQSYLENYFGHIEGREEENKNETEEASRSQHKTRTITPFLYNPQHDLLKA